MPGGNEYRKWYAMRNRLQAQGKWKGTTHPVPEQEEGEPPAKEPRTGGGDGTGDSGGDPGEGTSTLTNYRTASRTPDPVLDTTPTAEGRSHGLYWLYHSTVGERRFSPHS